MTLERAFSEKPVWILFDWGDTLMRVYPEYNGPMVSWPHVEAIPGAADAMSALSGTYHLALATNAEDSEESQIQQALARVGLAQWIEQIFCTKRLGSRKPQPEYFHAIAKHLNTTPNQMVMIGDSFVNDIQGALKVGLRGIWLNRISHEVRQGPGYCTIHALGEIEQVLSNW